MKLRYGKFTSPLIFVVVALCLAAVATGVVYWYLKDNEEKQRERYVNKQLQIYSSATKVFQMSFDTTAKSVFEVVINTPEIQLLMAQAVHADSKTQAHLRQKLYDKLEKAYITLEKNDLRQLHFHLPGSISFLRFHRPKKYGDSLAGVRITIDRVNQTHQSVYGFEEGKIYNGFRHVFPIFYHEQFVGSVEVSYSFDALRQQAQAIYPASYELILKKHAVHDKVMIDERNNYADTSLSEAFYRDRQLNPNETARYSARIIEAINHDVHSAIAPLLSQNTPFGVTSTMDHRDFLVLFDPLKSFDNQFIGYIVTYIEDPHLRSFGDDFWKLMIIGGIGMTLGSLLLAWLVYRIMHKEYLLTKMAHYDTLTGIYNRRFMNDQLQYMSTYSMRYSDPMSLIFMDIDYFKKINDTYGHHIGDHVLTQIAGIVRGRLRESDVFGRWGGEEFLIGLSNTRLEEAAQIAEEIRQKIESYPFTFGRVTCSFGIAQLQKEEKTHVWINRADHKLYEAKAAGRNRVFS